MFQPPAITIPESLPQGFQVGGVHCGVKPEATNLDLALFVSETPATSAGVFTTNKVCGAPVQLSRPRIQKVDSRAIVINSGNANACTGQQGLENAAAMTAEVAKSLDCAAEQVLICSTGVIGHQLPMPEILQGIPKVAAALGNQPAQMEAAGRAMMTTDTVPKTTSREIEIDGKAVRIVGFCKGAAMIKPNMATMLCTVLTDAALSPDVSQKLLTEAVEESFNSISVEGHTSTSDTVLMLANGASNAFADSSAEFVTALKEVCEDLAKRIVLDAEGASHFVTIEISGAADDTTARQLAETIADDALVKTAITGNDPNWGRIISACGRTGLVASEHELSLTINGFTLFETGTPLDVDLEAISQSMAQGDVLLQLTVATNGPGKARVWTCDLTQEYVRLNSEYTT